MVEEHDDDTEKDVEDGDKERSKESRHKDGESNGGKASPLVGRFIPGKSLKVTLCVGVAIRRVPCAPAG